MNNYDLSDNGRSAWTPDTAQPGYGNFCYGNREVTSIDNSTPGTNGNGVKTVSVTYHYKIAVFRHGRTRPRSRPHSRMLPMR